MARNNTASFESTSVIIPSIVFKWQKGETDATDEEATLKYCIFIVLIIFIYSKLHISLIFFMNCSSNSSYSCLWKTQKGSNKCKHQTQRSWTFLQWYHHRVFHNSILLNCAEFLHFLKSLLITVSSCQPHSIHLFPSHFSPSLLYQTLMCLCMPPFSLILYGKKTFNQKMYWKPNPLKKVMDLVCILYPFSLYFVAETSGTILYNTAGLCYQLFL